MAWFGKEYLPYDWTSDANILPPVKESDLFSFS